MFGTCGTSEKHSTNLAVTVLCTVVSFRDSSDGDFCRTVQTWGWGGGGAELVKQSTTLFRGLLMPGSWWQTCSEAVKNLKFLGKLSSVHAALVSYLAARFHSCAVTVQAAA